MKDINISVRFKTCGVTTICYVLIERKNVPVINEVNSILTTRLFMSSALTVAVELEQWFNLEVFCNKDTEFDEAFKREVKRALVEFHPDFETKQTSYYPEMFASEHRINCKTWFNFEYEKNHKEPEIYINLRLNGKLVLKINVYYTSILSGNLADADIACMVRGYLQAVNFDLTDHGLTSYFRDAIFVYDNFTRQLETCIKKLRKNFIISDILE
jgi:hypothetical protein